MAQFTVETLLAECQEQIKKGNGKKNIVLSDDNEGNGYHGMFYGFTELTAENREDFDNIYDSRTNSPDDTIILG